MRSSSRRLTRLGHIVEAFRRHDDPDAREALARMARELVQSACTEFKIDLLTELPLGFESGVPLSLLQWAPEQAPCVDLWKRGWASSYEVLPAPDVWERALELALPVQGRRVLLCTTVFDRPDIASGCVHLLRGRGASWVGLLALATELPRE